MDNDTPAAITYHYERRFLIGFLLLWGLALGGYALYETPYSGWDELFFLGIIIVGIVLFAQIRQKVLLPMQQLAAKARIVREQNLFEPIEYTETDALGDMAMTITKLQEQIREATEFIHFVTENPFTQQQIALASEAKDSPLARALAQMQARLRMLALQEQERTWANEGQAKFGDILRNHNESVKQLTDAVLMALVPYTNASQGGIFVAQHLSDTQIQLNMTAAYAYNRKKYLRREVLVEGDIAEGLLGQAFIERKSIYIEDLPSDYLRIVSGLGETPPKYLLIVPLLFNELCNGVIEMASLQAFSPTQIQFVEKVAESLASTITTVEANQRTRQLLDETQQQTEALRAQEEEMRQNLEELAATQEEMRRKQIELEHQNEKIRANEAVLQKALQRAKQVEMQIKEKNEMLASQEEEMRQNLEELAATQEEMQRRQIEMERQQEKMKANESILQKALQRAKQVEAELREKNEVLVAKEKEMRLNMEELTTVREEMNAKCLQYDQQQEKMRANAEMMQNTIQQLESQLRDKEAYIATLAATIQSLKA